MTDETLILEVLKKIQHELSLVKNDVREIKTRMGEIDYTLSAIRRDLAHHEEISARQQASIDRMSERMGRIETRLDLSGQP